MNDLRTPDEVAPQLRKTVKQLAWMRYSGNGPKFGKIGGRIMYRQRDVDQWLEEQFADNTAA